MFARQPLPSRLRTYHYYGHTAEFFVALYAQSYHGRARMVVMQEVATSRFVVITKEEFERNWVEC